MKRRGTWVPTLIAIALGVLGQAAPVLQDTISNHPHLTLILTTISFVLGHVLPQPQSNIETRRVP